MCADTRTKTYMKPEYLALLKKLKTDTVSHQRGTLYDHLTGTYNYLASWGAQEHVCSAGLFHSVYGTTIFCHQSVPYNDRQYIRTHIGEKGEDLVYTFSIINRPSGLITAIQDGYVFDTISQTKRPVSHEKLGELIEIEIANLLEQGNEPFFFTQLLHKILEGNFSLREPIVSVIRNAMN